MKAPLKTYALCLLVLIANACQRDFDEVNDTNQRHITFRFNTDSLFVNTLFYDGTYHFRTIDELPDNSRLRITAYCYNKNDALIYTTSILSTSLKDQQVSIRHLQKDATYCFVFIADIVTYDPFVDYYETWFQMGTKYWYQFYLYADNRHEEALYDVMGSHVCELQPANQTEEVVFLPNTYNGYIIFTHLDAVDRLSGCISYVNSFLLSTMTRVSSASMAYTFDYRAPEGSIVTPVSLSAVDDMVLTEIRTNTFSGIDTTYIDFLNEEHRPFVATIDCRNHRLDTCIFY